MESHQVLMTQKAAQDLKNIYSYIADDLREPSIAKKLTDKIKASVKNLAKLPLRHALVADKDLAAQGIRKLIVNNYIIFYIVSEKDKAVTVVRILYGRRNWIHLL